MSRERIIDAMAQVRRDHMRKNRVRGCIVQRWVCSCGEETEEFDRHVAAVELDAALAVTEEDGTPSVLGLVADPDEPHVIKFSTTGWVIKHPLIERVRDGLFACAWNERCHDLDGPPNGQPGEYDASIVDEEVVFVPRLSEDQT